MSGLFDKILLNAVRSGQAPAMTKQSIDWFQNKVKSTRATKANMLKDMKNRKKNKPTIGQMYFFSYENPKYKDTLPFWDAFPLVLPFSFDSTHMYALNLHYAPPKHRAVLMDSLYGLATNERMDQKTKLAMSWGTLRSLSKSKYMMPTVKSYLLNRVTSQFYFVEGSEWNSAIFLPFADWRSNTGGASSNRAYSRYRKSI